MTRQEVVTKIKQLPKRTVLFIAAGVGLIIVLLVVIGIFSAKSADTKAATYEKSVGTYVSSLEKTNKSINALTPVIKNPPKLQGAFLGFLSGNYQRASQKADALEVYQSEVFGKISAYDDNASFAKALGNAHEKYVDSLKNYRSSITESLSESGPIDQYKKALKSQYEQRLKSVKQYRQTISDTKESAYYTNVKAYHLRQLDDTSRLLESAMNEVDSADSYAKVRAADYKIKIGFQLPENDPKYGAYAINTLYKQSFKVSAPAITGLKETIKQIDDDKADNATVAAYRALYGNVAVYNTPTSADETEAKQRKLAVSEYALDTLTQKAQSFKGDAKDETIQAVEVAQDGLGDVSVDDAINGEPSAASRMSYAYRLAVDTGVYTGYQDLLRNIDNSAKSREIEKEARYDIPTYEKLREFSKTIYPSDFYKKEVTAYDAAIAKCIEPRIDFYKKAEQPLKDQLAVGQKVNGIAKEYRMLYLSNNKTPSAEDQQKLEEYGKKINAARAEIERLDAPVRALETKQKQGLDACLPALGEAQTAFNAKTTTNNGLYEYIANKSKAIYVTTE